MDGTLLAQAMGRIFVLTIPSTGEAGLQLPPDVRTLQVELRTTQPGEVGIHSSLPPCALHGGVPDSESSIPSGALPQSPESVTHP